MKNERDLLLCVLEWFLSVNGADETQVKMLMLESRQRVTLPAGQPLNRREFREKLQKMNGEVPPFLHAAGDGEPSFGEEFSFALMSPANEYPGPNQGLALDAVPVPEIFYDSQGGGKSLYMRNSRGNFTPMSVADVRRRLFT